MCSQRDPPVGAAINRGQPALAHRRDRRPSDQVGQDCGCWLDGSDGANRLACVAAHRFDVPAHRLDRSWHALEPCDQDSLASPLHLTRHVSGQGLRGFDRGPEHAMGGGTERAADLI